MVKNDQMIKDFVNAITYEVNDRRSQIEQNSQHDVNEQLEAAESKILKEVYTIVERKSADIRAQIGRELSAQMNELRRSLLERRQELADEVFKTVEEKIISFTQSSEYEQFIIKTAKKAVSALDGESTVFLREQDMKYAAAVTTALSCTVLPSNSIVLGGVMARSGNLIADDTLDARFAEEKAAFRENYKIEIW